jgi:hypothetical protein
VLAEQSANASFKQILTAATEHTTFDQALEVFDSINEDAMEVDGPSGYQEETTPTRKTRANATLDDTPLEITTSQVTVDQQRQYLAVCLAMKKLLLIAPDADDRFPRTTTPDPDGIPSFLDWSLLYWWSAWLCVNFIRTRHERSVNHFFAKLPPNKNITFPVTVDMTGGDATIRDATLD